VHARLEGVDALQWILKVMQNDPQSQFELIFASDEPGLLMWCTLYQVAAFQAGFRA